jgi:hypothetical protein
MQDVALGKDVLLANLLQVITFDELGFATSLSDYGQLDLAFFFLPWRLRRLTADLFLIVAGLILQVKESH